MSRGITARPDDSIATADPDDPDVLAAARPEGLDTVALPGQV